MNRIFRFSAGLLAFGLLTSSSFAEPGSVKIVDMKAAHNVDENFEPVQPAESFPAGTSKVFCWFKWKNDEVNEQMMARWTYLTEQISVLDYKVTLPRREGAGGVALAMPEGKTLPAGEYEVRMETDKKAVLKAIKFRVSEE